MYRVFGDGCRYVVRALSALALAGALAFPAMAEDGSTLRIEADDLLEWDQEAGSSWSAYEAMNEDFRDMLLDFLRAGDTVWVHDYHLSLLPQLLGVEEKRLDVKPTKKIFFLHIPFPVSMIFKVSSCTGWRFNEPGSFARGLG